ncbi:hypothetical protein ASPZODRAFT_96414 [Penicilliopsis zonata CBS 506.65]|uniref:Zn(2)-C6 fungal-type domain-containing protein n=1 Tax=Penicilliopsis zonata CBS 506.65 TaxID=1073090 RepID=A0A1L9SK03_9EURO|nr:hypothetical protein ASPZODRAFT_96414 [Penicilliopsis zonata CBS 506.65]OJJ47394.1 hypothetical protein ASPZODRAFT_96414 [Penicilliopsis zonata CBS 506.65]
MSLSRVRIACKACRQSKARCEMREAPCTRCTRLGLSCSVQPGFRREGRRERMRQLEDRVQRLQGLLTDGSSSTETTAATPVIVVATSYTIGEVTLSSGRVQRLFSVFWQRYHPVLPFLDESRPAAEYHGESELLFWFIISVAARHSSDRSLLARLMPLVSERLWTTVAASAPSRGLTQTLVLSSCWPLPDFRLSNDKSVIHANLALTCLSHLGLHASQEDVAAECLRIACTIQSLSSLSMDQGIPPPASVSLEIHPHSRIPLALRQNLQIQQWSVRALRTLFGDDACAQLPAAAVFYPTMESLERDFDGLCNTLGRGQQLSLTTALRLAAAGLYLDCLYFSETTPGPQRKQGILRAYKTAGELITTAISHDAAYDELRYSSVATARLLLTAAIVIFRVVHSTYAVSVDVSKAVVLYHSACFAIHRCSLPDGEEDEEEEEEEGEEKKDKDLPYRMVEALKLLWRMGETDTSLLSREPSLTVQNRICAGIFFDTVVLWRQYSRLPAMTLDFLPDMSWDASDWTLFEEAFTNH